jgi:transcriptional regulator with XRE-family HTH domain
MGVSNGIGDTLREARKRRGLDLNEIEAETKIRLRYLRAIENEEWEVLPGGSYTRAFIRTYASHLGLDGERLADEFRRGTGIAASDVLPHGEARPPRRLPRPSRRLPRPSGRLPRPSGRLPRPSGRLPRLSGGHIPRAWTVIAALGVVALLVAIALAIGGSGSSSNGPLEHHGKQSRQKLRSQAAAKRKRVSLRVEARAEIWVCLLDGSGKPLIDGQILEGGEEGGPFHSGAYTVSLGNGELTMLINGRRAEIPPTASPVGYRINSRGELKPLDEAERPTCT